MFLRLLRIHRKIPKWGRILVWTSIILMWAGVTANSLVLWANGGRMPVAVKKEDILFVIGSPSFGVTHFPGAVIFASNPDKQPLDDQTKLRLLADRIPITLMALPTNFLPRPIVLFLELYGLPLNDESIASIGDLFIWLGVPLAPPSLAICIFYILRRETPLSTKKSGTP